MSTGKRKSTETASLEGVTEVAEALQAPETGFVIQCSIKSKLLEIDEEIFTDCYGDEVDDQKQEAKDSAVARDGTWIWDSTSGKNAGVAGGSGNPVFFSTADAANKAAAEVWVSLLLSLAERPCTPLLDQLAEQAQTSSRGKTGSRGRSSRQARKRSKAGSAKKHGGGTPNTETGAGALKQQLQEMFAQPMSVLPEGRASWKASVEWFDDPFECTEPLENVVRSTVRVEVVQADLR